ncbi:alpha/beta hydrolase [Actinomycetota bacterium Odt1-20B]
MTTTTKRRTAVALTLLTALAAAPATAVAGDRDGTAPRGAVHESGARGTLLAVTPVADLTRTQVAAFLKKGDIGTDTVRYGVRAYRLTYRTVDTHGRPTTATGLLALPKGGPHRLGLVSDTHGTMVHRDYAPSTAEDFGRLSPFLHAAAGKAVAAPDYLGLGKGPGLHPYMDTASAVTASVDMLRAARTAAGAKGRPLTGDLYLTGFSQGGQVAMALGRELAQRGGHGYRVRALAPVSGPYDLAGQEIPALYDGRINDTSGVLYFSYFLVAQNRLHPLYKDPAEVFRAPYADRVEALYDGRHGEEDVFKVLPKNVKQLLTPAFYERMKHPEGGLKEALDANDGVCDWKPGAPVRLYAGAADTDVPIGNARSCAADLGKNGVRAPVMNQGDVDHFGSVQVAAPKIARWFAAVR